MNNMNKSRFITGLILASVAILIITVISYVVTTAIVKNKQTNGDKTSKIEYTIAYNLNGGQNSELNPSKYEAGTEVVFQPASKNGFEFIGWYSDEELTKQVKKIARDDRINFDLYAKWQECVYSINYENLDDAINDISNVHSYKFNQDIVFKDASKTGYKFLGWYLNSDFSGDKITMLHQNIADNITLYAKWEIIEYSIVFKIDGEVFTQYVFTVDTINDYELPDIPQRDGFTASWVINDRVIEEMVLDNLVLEARYEPV